MPPIELMTRNGIRSALSGVDSMPGSAHAGLWLDRFLRVLHPDSDDDKDAIRKLFCEVAACGVPAGYAEEFNTREARLKALTGGVENGVTRLWDAKVSGRMVIGLGVESLTEVGITLERTWGVPIIPGSALKGLAAVMAHRYGGPSWKQAIGDGEGGEDARLMFGNSESAGYVVFHDAWWNPEGQNHLPMDLDIMTVHYQDYYGGSGDPPADTDEPIPVSFLTARGTYLVALSGPRDWAERAAEWLRLGLEKEGIGGKTSAGYGRLVLEERIDPKDKKCRELLLDFEARFRGAANANQLVERLKEALHKGCDRMLVEKSGQALYDRDQKFWKNWLKKRLEAEREELRSLGLYDARLGSGDAAKPSGSPEMPSGSPRETAEGKAWTRVKNKKVYVHVDLKPHTLKKRLDKVEELDDRTREALENANTEAEGVPVICTYSVEGSQKTIRGLRLGKS